MPIGSILVVAAISISIGIAMVLIRRAIDRRIDTLQRSLNKIENMFAGLGASWLSEFLADLVVGDGRSILYKSNEIIQAVNSEKALFDKVAYPIARWAIDFCKRTNAPELDELKKLINQQ